VTDTIGTRVRELIGEVTGRADTRELTDDVALFGGGLGLDSLSGATLLRRIRDELGVDVAAEDLNLDALETVGTLSDYVRARSALSRSPDSRL
jgi:acyl carrier protein